MILPRPLINLLLVIFTFSPRYTDCSSYPNDYLCNNGTKFACICYAADGQLSNFYPACHAFLGIQTLQIAQITLKSNDLIRTIKTSYGEETYEHYFKRRVIAYLLNKHCYRQRSDCPPGIKLPVQLKNVLVLHIKCGEEKRSVIEYTVLKAKDQNLLTQENTLDPNFVIRIVNGTLNKVPTLLGRAVLMDHKIGYYAIPREETNDHMGRSVFGADHHRNVKEVQSHFTQNRAFYVVLMLIAILLIFLCCAGSVKLCRERKKRREEVAVAAAAAAGAESTKKSTTYGTIKKSEPAPKLEYELRSNAIASYNKPVEKSPSDESFPQVKLNYPQFAVGDAKKDSKISQIRKSVSDYVLTRLGKSNKGGQLRQSKTMETEPGARFPPIDEERVESAYLGEKLIDKSDRRKSASERNVFDEKYPQAIKSKTFDKAMIDKLYNSGADVLSEEEYEVDATQEGERDETFFAPETPPYTPGEVPQITINEISEENYENECEKSPCITQDEERAPGEEKEENELLNEDEKTKNESDLSSFRETDSESGESRNEEEEWVTQGATLNGTANYHQLVESTSSINYAGF